MVADKHLRIIEFLVFGLLSPTQGCNSRSDMTHELTTAYVAIAFLLFKGLANSELIQNPNDTEALVGFTTYFNCTTNIPSTEVHWLHYSVGSEEINLVYGYNQIYDPYKNRYEINKNEDTGEYNLVIQSVTIEDAGKIECQDDFGRGTRKSAQLTVLENEPVCHSNMRPQGIVGPNSCGIEPEKLLLSCAVQYRGNQPPVLEWRKNGTQIPISDGVNCDASNQSITCTLTLDGSSNIDGATFRCQTTKSVAEQLGCNSDVVKVIGSSSLSGKESNGVAICRGILVAILWSLWLYA